MTQVPIIPGDGTRYPSFRVLAMKVLGVELLALLALWLLQHTFAA